MTTAVIALSVQFTSTAAQTALPLTLGESDRLSDRDFVNRIFDQLTDDVVSVERDTGYPSRFTIGDPDLRFATIAFRARPVEDSDGLCAMQTLFVRFDDSEDTGPWPGIVRRPSDRPTDVPPGALRDQLVTRGGDFPKAVNGISESTRFRFASDCASLTSPKGFFSAKDESVARFGGLFVDAVRTAVNDGPPAFPVDCGDPDCGPSLGVVSLDRIMSVDDCDDLTPGALAVPERSMCVSIDLLNEANAGGWTSTKMYAVGRVNWEPGEDWTVTIDSVTLHQMQTVID